MSKVHIGRYTFPDMKTAADLLGMNEDDLEACLSPSATYIDTYDVWCQLAAAEKDIPRDIPRTPGARIKNRTVRIWGMYLDGRDTHWIAKHFGVRTAMVREARARGQKKGVLPMDVGRNDPEKIAAHYMRRGSIRRMENRLPRPVFLKLVMDTYRSKHETVSDALCEMVMEKYKED